MQRERFREEGKFELLNRCQRPTLSDTDLCFVILAEVMSGAQDGESHLDTTLQSCILLARNPIYQRWSKVFTVD